MNRNLIGMMFVIAFAAPNSAMANETSIDALLASCRVAKMTEDNAAADQLSPADALRLGRCAGYIHGLHQGINLLKEADPSVAICIPENATISQLARVFIKWADAHPELLHQEQSGGVIAAWAEAFHCAAAG